MILYYIFCVNSACAGVMCVSVCVRRHFKAFEFEQHSGFRARALSSKRGFYDITVKMDLSE
jgi:hypothetical protein